MKGERTTIQITPRSRFELLKIKGELLRRDGVDRTFDDIIQELIYYWINGIRREGYKL